MNGQLVAKSIDIYLCMEFADGGDVRPCQRASPFPAVISFTLSTAHQRSSQCST